jgi:hypothetical protein
VARGRTASLLEVGTGFHQDLSGRENIFLSGSLLGMHRSEIQHHFDEIVRFAGRREVYRHAGQALLERHVAFGLHSRWLPTSTQAMRFLGTPLSHSRRTSLTSSIVTSRIRDKVNRRLATQDMERKRWSACEVVLDQASIRRRARQLGIIGFQHHQRNDFYRRERELGQDLLARLVKAQRPQSEAAAMPDERRVKCNGSGKILKCPSRYRNGSVPSYRPAPGGPWLIT